MCALFMRSEDTHRRPLGQHGWNVLPWLKVWSRGDSHPGFRNAIAVSCLLDDGPCWKSVEMAEGGGLAPHPAKRNESVGNRSLRTCPVRIPKEWSPRQDSHLRSLRYQRSALAAELRGEKWWLRPGIAPASRVFQTRANLSQLRSRGKKWSLRREFHPRDPLYHGGA